LNDSASEGPRPHADHVITLSKPVRERDRDH
jgi:hypothetical protein